MSDNTMMADDEAPVQMIQLSDLDSATDSGKRLIRGNIDVIRNVKVRLSVSAGQCEMTVSELMDLRENSVLTLDKAADSPVDIVINGNVVARGDLVAVGEQFGVRITEIHAG